MRDLDQVKTEYIGAFLFPAEPRIRPGCRRRVRWAALRVSTITPGIKATYLKRIDTEAYEKGRQFATIAPRSMPLRVNGKLNLDARSAGSRHQLNFAAGLVARALSSLTACWNVKIKACSRGAAGDSAGVDGSSGSGSGSDSQGSLPATKQFADSCWIFASGRNRKQESGSVRQDWRQERWRYLTRSALALGVWHKILAFLLLPLS
jgi:hypothetical protein